MANLEEAYKSAADLSAQLRKPKNSMLQDIVGSIAGDLQKDLDPNNMDPLGPTSTIINALTNNSLQDLKTKNIKRAAEHQATLGLAAWEAKAPLRALQQEDDISTNIEQAARRRIAEKEAYINNAWEPTMKVANIATGDMDKKDISAILKPYFLGKSKATFEQLKEAATAGDIFTLVDQDDKTIGLNLTPGVDFNGKKLIIKGANEERSLFHARNQFKKNLQQNYENSDPTGSLIFHKNAGEPRNKMMGSKEFYRAIQKTAKDMEMGPVFENHATLNIAYKKEVAELNKNIKENSTNLAWDMDVLAGQIQAYSKTIHDTNIKNSDPTERQTDTSVLVKEHRKLVRALRTKKEELKSLLISGALQKKALSKVNSIAAALSMMDNTVLKGKEGAAQNYIRRAWEMLPLDEDFVRVAEKLERAKNRQDPNLGPLTPASTTTTATPLGDNAKPAVPRNAVAPAKRVEVHTGS